MRSMQRELIDKGQWRGGPRTLLAAIGMQDRELILTAGLAWLLRPDGHHGLGSTMLSRLLALVGIGEPADGVRVVREESRGDDRGSGLERTTRADLVLYGSGWTIVCEAKTYASEQDQQLDRLHHHWKREAVPHFLFLTRSTREPISATNSRMHWHLHTWGEIAEITRQAASERQKVAAGVRDYIETLEAYHRV